MTNPNSNSEVTLHPKDLADFLSLTALNRSVFIWGPPGVGKSSIVNQFANSLDLECVSLIGSQLRPEDVMGIPQMMDGSYRYAPPAVIARHEKYCLFLDEFNASSSEVQKAFHTLIHDRRIGEYVMPKGSIVIAAGNRAHDGAKVNPLSSIIINRMLHVTLETKVDDWIEWAKNNKLHPVIIDYLTKFPDHLSSTFDPLQLAFTTPRSWHILSDSLAGISSKTPNHFIKSVCFGTLAEDHAINFLEFSQDRLQSSSIQNILENRTAWPTQVKDELNLNFLASSLKRFLYRQLPSEEMLVTPQTEQLVRQSKVVLDDLYGKRPQLVDYIISSPIQENTTWNKADIHKKEKGKEKDNYLPYWFRNKVFNKNI